MKAEVRGGVLGESLLPAVECRNGRLARVRQWIEAVFDTLKGQLSLEQHGGRTLPGVFARAGQRLLALAAGIGHNGTHRRQDQASLIAFDH